MSLEGMLTWLEHDDTNIVRTALISLTETDRKTLGPKARGWLTRVNPTRVSSTHAALAVLATAGGWRQAMIAPVNAYGLDSSFVDHAVAILQARSPSWLPEFVVALLEDEGIWNWRLARGLVRAQAAPPPDHPQYFRGTVRGLPDRFARDRRPLIDQLHADPDLASEHLFNMLSTEGTGRLLAFHDNFQESTYEHLPDHDPFAAGTWRVSLVTLVHERQLDRGRLLDAVLAAPLRDWAAADLGWYVGMHDALEPTLDEITGRQATYARLLTVEHGPSVKAAQREISRMLGDPRFNPILVLDASKATLGRSDKATVAAQLRMLDKLAKAHPDIAIAETVRIAADHPRADLREQAVKLLDRLGETAPALEPQRPFVAPAVEPWPTPQPVTPIKSADELGETLLALIEEIDAVEMERAVDGLLRFADQRPQISELLWTRVNQGQYYNDPRIAPVTLARAWLAPRERANGEWPIVLGRSVFRAEPALPETFVGALGRRLTGIAQAIRRGPHPAVALPSHADGSIDADVLTQRLSLLRRRDEPLELEVAVALLRVPPAERSDVVLPASIRESRAVAHALASPHTWERQVVNHQRLNWEPARRIPIFRDRAGSEGDALDGVAARPRPERTLGVEVAYGEYEPRFEQTLALGATLLPHDPDVLAAHAHPYLHRDLRKNRAASVPILDALARSRTANGAPASSALILGMAAKDARARTAARDALIDRARHGVLDGAALGRQGALLMHDEIVVGQRLSTGFADVTRASDAAVSPLLDALQELMAVLPGRRDAGPFVELAADLAERTGRKFQLPVEFRHLAAGKSTSVVAKAARRLA
ncbi:DUF6493 family protein [Agromyces badenianii]|uniref:DUF6493 family protein n=1 Tax=Agromyces badenianii TaxID=2080742 RepID=UPI00105979D3|nr:DUF6493 family protein [Agromyces badenianii]